MMKPQKAAVGSLSEAGADGNKDPWEEFRPSRRRQRVRLRHPIMLFVLLKILVCLDRLHKGKVS